MIVETENLTKRFKRHEAVNGVSLVVPEGSTFALIGANGAGKTTTLRMLVNLLQPDLGSARVLGVDSQALKAEDYSRIGYVAESQVLPEALTVHQFFEYLRKIYSNWDRPLEEELVRFFDLPRAREIGKLSTGTRMKVKVAAALAFNPKLLVLDEPLSGLDALVRDEVMAGVLKQAADTTVIISSHEVAEIENCVTHVAFMSNGRLVTQESIESLHARFREVSATFDHEVGNAGSSKSWLAEESAGRTMRFVDAAFKTDDELRAALGARHGSIVHYESKPLALRDISKALFRAARTEFMS